MLKPVISLASWTVLIWLNRIVNVARDNTSSENSLYLAIFFVCFGFTLAIIGYFWSEAKISTGILAFTIYTISALGCLRWIYRTTTVMGQDYSIGFEAVHVGLAAGTIILSTWATIKITKTMKVENKLKLQAIPKES